MYPPRERREEDYQPPSEFKSAVVWGCIFLGTAAVLMLASRSVRSGFGLLLLAFWYGVEALLIRKGVAKKVRTGLGIGLIAAAYAIYWRFYR